MIEIHKYKKLLIVNPISSWGGASVALLTVINALELAGNYQLVILFNKRGPAYAKFTELGYECQVLSYPTIGNAGGRKISLSEFCKFMCYLPISALRLICFIKKRDFDCLYLNTGVCLAPALIGKILGLPIIWHIRELLGSKSLLSRWHCSLVASLSDLVIANSASSGSVIADATNCSLIYDGISEEFAENIPIEDVQQIKDSWGFPEGVVVVGLVAAISWSKGHFVLIDALSKVVDKFPLVRVVFIGGTVTPSSHHKTLRARVKKMLGGYSDAEEYLKTKVEAMGLKPYVRFDGWQTDRELVKRVHAMDIVAFPSTIPEGFGRPVAEAAMAGKPSIGTDGGALSELIKHDYTGWIVPRNDPDKLSECLVTAVSNLNRVRNMGGRAHTLALQRFTMTIHNQKILQAFDGIIYKESKT